jgi:hypothetical protein
MLPSEAYIFGPILKGRAVAVGGKNAIGRCEHDLHVKKCDRHRFKIDKVRSKDFMEMSRSQDLGTV